MIKREYEPSLFKGTRSDTPLNRARVKSGLTWLELSTLSGVQQPSLARINNGSVSSIYVKGTEHGEWKADVISACECLGINPEDVFPNEMAVDREDQEPYQTWQERTAEVDYERTVDANKYMAVAKHILNDKYLDILLSAVVEGESYVDIGKRYGMSKQAVFEYAKKAMEKVRLAVESGDMKKMRGRDGIF